jgi:hypothetical protein
VPGTSITSSTTATVQVLLVVLIPGASTGRLYYVLSNRESRGVTSRRVGLL